MARNDFGKTEDDYLRALKAVSDSGRMKILQAHLKTKDYTATWRQLAKEVGYKDYFAINLHYGALAELVASELGVPQPRTELGEPFWLYVLVDWAPTPEGEDQRFVLRPEVVKALGRMGF